MGTSPSPRPRFPAQKRFPGTNRLQPAFSQQDGLRGHGVADVELAALPGDELHEEVGVAETPAHVGAVVALFAEYEDGQAVSIGEALDVVVDRVGHQASLAVVVPVSSALCCCDFGRFKQNNKMM